MEEKDGRFFNKGEENSPIQKNGKTTPVKPKKPIVDALLVTGIGLAFILGDMLVRYGFNRIVLVKRAVPLYFVGLIIGVVGLIMLIVALVKKSKNKAEHPSPPDSSGS